MIGKSSRSICSSEIGGGIHPADDALEPHHRRQADLQVQVGRLVLHDRAEELVDLRLAAGVALRRKFIDFSSRHGGSSCGGSPAFILTWRAARLEFRRLDSSSAMGFAIATSLRLPTRWVNRLVGNARGRAWRGPETTRDVRNVRRRDSPSSTADRRHARAESACGSA